MIDLVRRLYAALAVGDRHELDALLAPGFVGVLAEGMPFGAGGTHHGAAAMRREGWGAIGRHFVARAEPERFLPIDEGRLLITGRYVGEGRHGGGRLDAAFAHLVTVTDGRISGLEQYTDTARWAVAAAPAPAPEPAPEPARASAPAARVVELRIADGLARIALNRPGRGNAIDDGVTAELVEVATRLAEDPTVRAVLLTGEGPMFSVGGDLELLAGTPPERLPGVLRRMIDDYHHAIERLTGLDAPLVVAVRGGAAGGGLGLVCAADIALAAEDAVFALGYARLGLTADGGTSWYLPRLLGLRRAQEMFLLNRRLTAAEALEWGLVTRVLPADEVEPAARAIAEGLAAGPTRALGGMRRLLRTSFDTGLREQLAVERDLMLAAAEDPDAREGIAAFTAHRRPHFAGGATP